MYIGKTVTFKILVNRQVFVYIVMCYSCNGQIEIFFSSNFIKKVATDMLATILVFVVICLFKYLCPSNIHAK